MTGFSATDAALEGFRITREKPKALLAWTAFSFLVSVVGVLITVNMPAEARAALEALQSNQNPDIENLMEALAILSPMLLFGLAVQCVMAAAVYRIILRPADEKFSYLRLGKDELRLMALTLIYLVLGVMLLAAVQLAIVIITFAASPLGQGAMMFVGSAAELFTLGVFFYVGVRMSLAPVITFDRGRLAILDSWTVTHGQFWRLLGAYVLAICCVFVVAILVLMLFYLISLIVMLSMGGTFGDLRQIFQPDETTLRSYLNPFMIAYMVVGSLFTAIYYAVIAAPGALAYRELTGAAPAAA
ncbi:MAG TPA: hypothetical protein VFE03_14850 [Caulobacteraceae bacterium]|nr:hypothetical protein [Caulobacteraceae bacterium]